MGCIALLLSACDDDDEGAGGDSSPDATDSTGEATPTVSGGATGGTFSSSQLPIPVTVTASEGFTVPEEADISDLFAVYQPEFPNGYVDFLQPTQVYSYASGARSEPVDPPADYVQWFNDLPYATVVETQTVTVGGRQANRLEMKNADEEEFAIFKLSDGSDYHFDYLGQTGFVYAYVIDVNGTQILAMCGTEIHNNFSEFAATCEEVVSSAEFGR